MLPQVFKAGQNYTGKGAVNSNLDKITAEVNLNYIKLPIYGRLSFGKSNSKLSSFVQFGLSGAFLSNFKEVNTYYYTPGIQNNYTVQQLNTIYELEGIGTQTRQVNGVTKYDTNKVKYDKGFYAKKSLAVNLGYGINYNINSNVSLYAQVHAEYGLSNIEQTDTIRFVDPVTNLPDGNYFLTNMFKYCKYNTSIQSSDPARSTYTNNLFIGLQLGLIYKFGNNKEASTR